MSDIKSIDLRLVDATLLMVFLGIMRHRQATAVARDMGLTQPAVSHAIKRLRALYDDPLFLRRAHGLEPTALARELEPKIQQIVHLISETLSDAPDFDPTESVTDMRIGAFDYELATVLPALVTELHMINPNIGIHTYPLTNRDALDALVDGRIDMAIGYFDFPKVDTETFIADALCTEHYVVAARHGHPVLEGDLTLQRFAAADHLLISPFGPVKNMVDHALQLIARTRNVQATVPSLFAALSIVETTDLVVTLPSRVARQNSDRFKITHAPLPIDGGTFELHCVRHVRDAKSATHNWMVDRLKRLVAD